MMCKFMIESTKNCPVCNATPDNMTIVHEGLLSYVQCDKCGIGGPKHENEAQAIQEWEDGEIGDY